MSNQQIDNQLQRVVLELQDEFKRIDRKTEQTRDIIQICVTLIALVLLVIWMV